MTCFKLFIFNDKKNKTYPIPKLNFRTINMLLSEGSGWKMKRKMKRLLKKINLKIYFFSIRILMPVWRECAGECRFDFCRVCVTRVGGR